MATGIGFLLGPIWGSFMYNLGGYPAPFGSMALFYIIAYPFCTYQLVMEKNNRFAKEAALKKTLDR